MSNLVLIPHPVTPQGVVKLPASKSISNRVLILCALADRFDPISNLAQCDDTRVMTDILNSNSHQFNVGHAGTSMRFLTAFLARTCGIWELTGSERMQQRPIGILVDALNQLGGKIKYKGRIGYPPLLIHGSYLRGGDLTISASVSSQYISALLMIAPTMHHGITIHLEGEIVSRTYIDMTIGLMRRFGVNVDFDGHTIRVEPGDYHPVDLHIENDWSAASYLFEILAIAQCGQIFLQGLDLESLQGDSKQYSLWQRLGVESQFTKSGVELCYRSPAKTCFQFDADFMEMPDLVPSFAVACAMRNIPFHFTGVGTLRIKECDRLAALQSELAKFGYQLTVTNNTLTWSGERIQAQSNPLISTFDDHRMAMAFAPIAFAGISFIICNGEVVSKSFPNFWHILNQLGIEIITKTDQING